MASKLRLHWSPEQIAGWLKRTYPEHENRQVSHETINKSLFIQARGALKKELHQHLRSQCAIRRSRHASQKGDGRGQIKDMVSIRERPAAVEDRAVQGHWEGDLIFGTNNSQIATLVERRTRYLMLAKVSNKNTETGQGLQCGYQYRRGSWANDISLPHPLDSQKGRRCRESEGRCARGDPWEAGLLIINTQAGHHEYQ